MSMNVTVKPMLLALFVFSISAPTGSFADCPKHKLVYKGDNYIESSIVGVDNPSEYSAYISGEAKIAASDERCIEHCQPELDSCLKSCGKDQVCSRNCMIANVQCKMSTINASSADESTRCIQRCAFQEQDCGLSCNGKDYGCRKGCGDAGHVCITGCQ